MLNGSGLEINSCFVSFTTLYFLFTFISIFQFGFLFFDIHHIALQRLALEWARTPGNDQESKLSVCCVCPRFSFRSSFFLFFSFSQCCIILFLSFVSEKNMKYLYRTAKRCTFWSEKQRARVVIWCTNISNKEFK